MMDVEDFGRIVGDAIKDSVGIAPVRRYADVRAAWCAARAGRPPRDVSDDLSNSPFDDGGDRRIMNHEPVGNCGEVVEASSV
jgi:hypothetical protein